MHFFSTQCYHIICFLSVPAEPVPLHHNGQAVRGQLLAAQQAVWYKGKVYERRVNRQCQESTAGSANIYSVSS